jgi:hypothetical protein
MTSAAAALLVALVAEDPTVLRNAPRDDAPAQATLYRGDWLEVRGEMAGFLRVYDHRHERPGYVRPALVRVERVDEASARELGAVVRFLRDSGGNESLGIAYAALALRAAPAGADTSEILAAIGTMADRLARRASARHGGGAVARDTTLAGELEVAESYGVHFRPFDGDAADGVARLCYDGEAWARVLAAPAAPPIERARAALYFAGERCMDAAAAPAVWRAFNDRRLEALASVDPAALPAWLAARLRLGRAEALAWRGYDEARRAGTAPGGAAAKAEAEAVRELALVDRGQLAPEDAARYDGVAVRVAATRFAVEPAPRPDARKREATVTVVPRAAGESCVRVLERGAVAGERCTYGVVWASALRWAPSGAVATIAVQPLPAWTELWVLRRSGPGAAWTIETLAPATADPDAGYVEAAGFSPDGAHLLVVREARAGAGGRVARRFQVLATATLAVEKQASAPTNLVAFKRWSAPSWRAGTLALR